MWHVSDKSAFPFIVEVVGTNKSATDVLKKVVQDISSIEVRLSKANEVDTIFVYQMWLLKDKSSIMNND